MARTRELKVRGHRAETIGMASRHAAGQTDIGPGFDSLLTAAVAGAPWALDRLYNAFAPRVAGYLTVQGAEDPDGLTNEVFLTVLTKVRTFQGNEDRFRSWVFTVAHSRLVDDRRRRDRRPRTVDGAEMDAPGETGNVEDEALGHLARERVRDICGRLPGEQCNVLLLRLVGGLTIEEVARVVGRSSGAVKALQRRGVANLRRLVELEAVSL